MRKTALILGLIGLVSVSCTTMGPKAVFTDDRALGDLTVPVEYEGGLPLVSTSTVGVLRITPASTRFVSDRGVTHLNLPTSSIRDVYVKTEAKLNAGNTALRFMFMSVFALLLKDKTEFLSLEFEEPGKSTSTRADFKVKVGSGQALKSAIIEKRDMAIAAMTPGEKPAAAKPDYERAFDRAMAVDTIPAWEEYIRTQTNPEFREKARLRLKELMEESDWSTTKAADTAAKYEEFLARNPDSKHADEARTSLVRIKEGKSQKAGEELAAGLEKAGQQKELADAKSLPSPKENRTIDQELRGSILTGNAHRLAEFVGEWFGDVALSVPGAPSLLLIGPVSIEQPNQMTISTQFSQSGKKFRLTLEYDSAQKNYLLTYESDVFPALQRLPLTYSDEKGFSGGGEITVRGVKKTVDATIVPLKEAGYRGYRWKLIVLDGVREESSNVLTFSRKER